MTENEKTARAFAAQFNPPLTVCKTDRVNNVPIPDAWTCSFHDGARGLGVMAVAYRSGLHAYLEAAGASSIAEDAGAVMARALGMFTEDDATAP